MRSFCFGTVGLAGIGCLVAGCVLFTGSTNGYTQIDAGEDAGGACASSADCADPDASLCCFGLSSAGFASVCQNSCQGELVQLCKANAECGGASCITQECLGITFQGCGIAITGNTCKDLSDAGASDASSNGG
jgi:hypothetical protein